MSNDSHRKMTQGMERAVLGFAPLREAMMRTAASIQEFGREIERSRRMAIVRRRAVLVRQQTEAARRDGGCW